MRCLLPSTRNPQLPCNTNTKTGSYVVRQATAAMQIASCQRRLTGGPARSQRKGTGETRMTPMMPSCLPLSISISHSEELTISWVQEQSETQLFPRPVGHQPLVRGMGRLSSTIDTAAHAFDSHAKEGRGFCSANGDPAQLLTLRWANCFLPVSQREWPMTLALSERAVCLKFKPGISMTKSLDCRSQRSSWCLDHGARHPTRLRHDSQPQHMHVVPDYLQSCLDRIWGSVGEGNHQCGTPTCRQLGDDRHPRGPAFVQRFWGSDTLYVEHLRPRLMEFNDLPFGYIWDRERPKPSAKTQIQNLDQKKQYKTYYRSSREVWLGRVSKSAATASVCLGA